VQRDGKVERIGFTCGAFDLLHAGHVLMLQEARSVCDRLVVGLQEDPSLDRKSKNKPIQTLEERLIQLEAVRYVDEVRLYGTESDLMELLEELDIDVRIVGADHAGHKITGDELGIPIYYNSRDHAWSTSDLRARVYRDEFERKVIEETDEPGSRVIRETRP